MDRRTPSTPVVARPVTRNNLYGRDDEAPSTIMTIPLTDAVVLVEPDSSNYGRDLPSTLDYKDQGRDLQSVMANSNQPSNVPSILNYKDQGRQLGSGLIGPEPNPQMNFSSPLPRP